MNWYLLTAMRHGEMAGWFIRKVGPTMPFDDGWDQHWAVSEAREAAHYAGHVLNECMDWRAELASAEIINPLEVA